MIPLVLCHIALAPHFFAGGGASEGRGGSEDVSVPKDIDLMALPQLCFPGIWYSLTHAWTHTHTHTVS